MTGTDFVAVHAGNATLLLAPDVGGSVAAWTRAGEPIFRAPPVEGPGDLGARALASYPLVPFSNRVANRCFDFSGKTYELPNLMNGFAIHGAGWQLPWTATHEDNVGRMALDFTPGPLWPFAFRAEQIFTLTENALVCTISIENRHTAPAPAAIGLHPYFPRSPHTTLQFTAGDVWFGVIADHRGPVPAEWDCSTARTIDTMTVDNCFNHWNGQARLAQPDRGYAIEMTADPVFEHCIVFVPSGKDFCAIEPVSNMTDGLNRMDRETDHGIHVLAPGERLEGSVRFSLK